ncbi:MAG: hypothetical protein GY915_02640, partial [bacterium]|nr:hypothetical protein [bacterium]
MIAGKYGYLEATEEEYLNYYEDQPCSYSTSNRMDFDWFRKQDDLPEAVSAFLLSKPTITDGWSLIDDGIRELWNQPGESWFFDRLVAASVNGFDGYVRSLPGVIGLIEDYSRRALPAALYLRSLGFQYKTLGYNMSPEHASQFIWNHRIPYTMNRTKLLGYEIQDGDEAV